MASCPDSDSAAMTHGPYSLQGSYHIYTPDSLLITGDIVTIIIWLLLQAPLLIDLSVCSSWRCSGIVTGKALKESAGLLVEIFFQQELWARQGLT